MPITVRNIRNPADGDLASGESINAALRELSDLLDMQQHLPFMLSADNMTQLLYSAVAFNAAASVWCAVGTSTNSGNSISRTLTPGVAVDSGFVREYQPVGTAAQIASGINDWSSTASGHGAADLVDVCVGPSDLFVAVGQTGTLKTSPDGAAWTAQAAAGGYTGTFNSIAWNGAVLAAVGTSGQIQTSSNGTAWTARTPGSGYSGAFNRVRWDGTVFIAVGNDGEIQTSPDGITWTRRVA